MAGVTLKNVKKVYDKHVVAVQAFSLDLADKEFIVLVGPSGCGKSTTLRMVAGLEEITEGELFIGETVVNDVPPKDRNIAMVFQNYALYPHMTVFENMAFGLKLRREPKDVIRKKVKEAAEILDITPYLERKPKALSGGQRQRVAIGRAIVRNPQVFLMDEPLSNLDAKLRNQMRAEIIKLRRRIDTTFIYVTHDQTEAMTLGDRIVIMKDGFIQQIGTPQEVFDQPANLFVAGFIGSPQMNFFDAALLLADGGWATELGGVRFPLSRRKNQILNENGAAPAPVTLGVRPDHITLCDPASGLPSLPATVEVSEMMGSSIHLHLRYENTPFVVVVSTVELPEEHRGGFSSGTPVHFTFSGDMMHLFAKETEENLV